MIGSCNKNDIWRWWCRRENASWRPSGIYEHAQQYIFYLAHMQIHACHCKWLRHGAENTSSAVKVCIWVYLLVTRTTPWCIHPSIPSPPGVVLGTRSYTCFILQFYTYFHGLGSIGLSSCSQWGGNLAMLDCGNSAMLLNYKDTLSNMLKMSQWPTKHEISLWLEIKPH